MAKPGQDGKALASTCDWEVGNSQVLERIVELTSLGMALTSGIRAEALKILS